MKIFSKYLIIVFLCCFFAPGFCLTKIEGKFVSNDSNVFGELYVTKTGVLFGSNSNFLKLSIEGTANLIKCNMQKEVISKGVLNAIDTNFCHDLIVCSGKTTLDSCKVKDLYILDDFESDRDCTIEICLNSDTKVSGCILFQSGRGKVYKSPTTIIEGEIVGGEVIEIDD